MKVFGKRTLTIDCSWELVDDSKLSSKLISLTDKQLVDYCFENGNLKKDIITIQNFKLII